MSAYRPMIQKEDECLDDELDQFMLLIMGRYQKMRHMKRKRRISVFGHKVYNREREEHAEKLYRDYFAENPTYFEKIFW